MLKQNILTLILMLLPAQMLHAQPQNEVIADIMTQVRRFPQEKAYIHTDASDYIPGGRIWMKAYVVNALSHVPADESKYVYVELISPEGTIENRVRLLCREGIYAGYMDIPAAVSRGTYLLRAYTDLMTNVRGYESVKTIYVGQSGKRKETLRDESIKAVSDAPPRLRVVREGGRVRISVAETGSGFSLLAHCRAYPFFYGKAVSSRPVVFSADSLPQGVVSLLLLDERKNVVEEQLFFSDNHSEECRLQIVSDRQQYARGDVVVLKLHASGLHAGEHADLSVSVSGTGLPHFHRPSSVMTHLFLTSDVAGYVANPEYVHARPARIDSLLNGKKWTRYDFASIFKGTFAEPVVRRETSGSIAGKVRSLIGRRPVVGAEVNLISPQVGIYAHAVTDKTGRFLFSGMDFPAGTQYVLNAFNRKGGGRVELTVEEKDFPPYDMPDMETAGCLSEEIPADSSEYLSPEGIRLKDVEVTARIRNSAARSDVYARLSDFSFGLQQIEEIGATCLHELLRMIPGVFVRESKCYIRAAGSIMGDNPAAIAIDGIFVDEDYDLDNIQMTDVARVDVFKTGTTVIWGSRGGSGVISITTKLGNYRIDGAEHPNQKKTIPLGYQPPVRFAGGDNGCTLYWNPSVTTGTLQFATGSHPGRYLIVVEGVTSEGRLIHEEKEFEIN